MAASKSSGQVDKIAGSISMSRILSTRHCSEKLYPSHWLHSVAASALALTTAASLTWP